ncbi:MAG: hypothetical protein AB7P21_25455 [Lautropia sp.]
MHAFRRTIAIHVAAFTLASCGGGDTQDVETHIDTAGRLVIAQNGSTSIRVHDLDTQTLAGTFVLANPPSALYASPGKRYAVAPQREQDLTQFVDGGIWQEDHVDHLHDYKESPQLSSFRVSGVRPTHFEAHDDHAALFMDGVASSGTPASVVLLSDAAIGKGAVDASVELPMQMHGTGEPRGDYLLTTFRAADNVDTLPVQVELYRRSGSGYSLVTRFDEQCPSLHGSYSNEKHTVFGCSDGVLAVTQVGDTFTAKKIANPAGLPTDLRVGTIAGHHERPTFIGIAGTGTLFDIDVEAGTMTEINWASGRTRRAHAFDRDGANFLVLDDLGTIHLLDATRNWAVRATLPAIATMPTASPFPTIAASGKEAKAFVTDPGGQRIVVVDVGLATLAAPIALGFAPMAAVWVGVGEHAHE